MKPRTNHTRITIDMPKDDHKRLKMMTAMLGISMREAICGWIHSNLHQYDRPNEETLQAIEDIESGKDLFRCENLEELYMKLGI